MNIKGYGFYYKLRTLPFVREIWLFGSRAAGSHQARSDFDLAIVCPEANDEEWHIVLSIVENADTLLKIDCIRFDTLQDDRLQIEIERSKKVLFKRVENSYSWYETFLDLGEALEKFEEVIAFTGTFPYIMEATIQIFEYSFELYWKLLKKICVEEGFEVNSPRSAFRQAYAIKLIENEKAWLNMIEDRNLTSHTYKHPVAFTVFSHCKIHCSVMQENYIGIKKHFRL